MANLNIQQPVQDVLRYTDGRFQVVPRVTNVINSRVEGRVATTLPGNPNVRGDLRVSTNRPVGDNPRRFEVPGGEAMDVTVEGEMKNVCDPVRFTLECFEGVNEGVLADNRQVTVDAHGFKITQRPEHVAIDPPGGAGDHGRFDYTLEVAACPKLAGQVAVTVEAGPSTYTGSLQIQREKFNLGPGDVVEVGVSKTVDYDEISRGEQTVDITGGGKVIHRTTVSSPY